MTDYTAAERRAYRDGSSARDSWREFGAMTETDELAEQRAWDTGTHDEFVAGWFDQ